MDQFSHGLQNKKLDSRKRYKSPIWKKVTVQHYPWQSTICSDVGFSVVLKVAKRLTRLNSIHRPTVQSRTLFPKNTTDPSWPPHPYGLVESLRPRLKPKDERTSTVPGESRRPVNLEIRETMQVRGLFFWRGMSYLKPHGFNLPMTWFFWTHKTCGGILTWNKVISKKRQGILCLWKYRQNAIFPNTMDVSKIDFLLADGLDEMNLWSFPNWKNNEAQAFSPLKIVPFEGYDFWIPPLNAWNMMCFKPSCVISSTIKAGSSKSLGA